MIHNALINSRQALARGAKTLVMTIVMACIASSLSARTYSQELIVSATCYSRQEFGGKKTASGKRTSTNYIAIARHLVKKFPFGTRVKLTCGDIVLEKIVEDTMGLNPKTGKPWTWKVDIFRETNKECYRWGHKKGCRLEKEKRKEKRNEKTLSRHSLQ